MLYEWLCALCYKFMQDKLIEKHIAILIAGGFWQS